MFIFGVGSGRWEVIVGGRGVGRWMLEGLGKIFLGVLGFLG